MPKQAEKPPQPKPPAPKNPITAPHKQKAFLQQEAAAQGFAAMRILRADDPAIAVAGAQYLQRVAQKHYADLDYMYDTADRRADPRVLWPDVRSVIMLGFNYGPAEDPRALQNQPNKAAISVYARNRDYHDIIKGKLKHIATRFAARSGAEVKVFVDTAPVMEKPLAQIAGIGFQGKHTNLVSRQFGSWLFLSSIFTAAELPPDAAEVNHCGKCAACLAACPTNAFIAPFQLDAAKCISYLTIECKTPIPRALRPMLGNRIYGCDDCLAACPWNKFAQITHEAKLQARHDLLTPPIGRFLAMNEAEFRSFFSGSPIKRIGHARFLRNVLYAAGNSGNKRFIAAIKPHLAADSPLMRGAAIWALGRLMAKSSFAKLKAECAPQEQEAQVLEEWAAASAETIPAEAAKAERDNG